MITKKNGVLSLPTLWMAIFFAIFYSTITLIYLYIPLLGRVAMPLFLIGAAMAWPFGLSIIASAVSIFFWKSYKISYLPMVVSVLTFAFLYFFWIALPQTYQAQLNGYRGQFWSYTGYDLPGAMTRVNEFDSGSSIFGDGTYELSFNLSQEELSEWMQHSGFQWKQGPRTKTGATLNQYGGGSLNFLDGPDVQYVVINRTPKNIVAEGDSAEDTTSIYVNQKEGWILISDYNL